VSVISRGALQAGRPSLLFAREVFFQDAFIGRSSRTVPLMVNPVLGCISVDPTHEMSPMTIYPSELEVVAIHERGPEYVCS
jgi:hypothetical protein